MKLTKTKLKRLIKEELGRAPELLQELSEEERRAMRQGVPSVWTLGKWAERLAGLETELRGLHSEIKNVKDLKQHAGIGDQKGLKLVYNSVFKNLAVSIKMTRLEIQQIRAEMDKAARMKKYSGDDWERGEKRPDQTDTEDSTGW